jgi:hypothetical protein
LFAARPVNISRFLSPTMQNSEVFLIVWSPFAISIFCKSFSRGSIMSKLWCDKIAAGCCRSARCWMRFPSGWWSISSYSRILQMEGSGTCVNLIKFLVPSCVNMQQVDWLLFPNETRVNTQQVN